MASLGVLQTMLGLTGRPWRCGTRIKSSRHVEVVPGGLKELCWAACGQYLSLLDLGAEGDKHWGRLLCLVRACLRTCQQHPST
jgi:hypothetical protein